MSTILELYKRPVVLFDAANSQHRKWYSEFIKTNTWGKCPVRFAVVDGDGVQANIISNISKQITTYYLNREFNKPKKYGTKALP